MRYFATHSAFQAGHAGSIPVAAPMISFERPTISCVFIARCLPTLKSFYVGRGGRTRFESGREFIEQVGDSALDLVSNHPNRLEVLPLGVFKFPIEISLSQVHRA